MRWVVIGHAGGGYKLEDADTGGLFRTKYHSTSPLIFSDYVTASIVANTLNMPTEDRFNSYLRGMKFTGDFLLRDILHGKPMGTIAVWVDVLREDQSQAIAFGSI